MPRTMMRSELYNLVWAKPVTKVAQELGISDVGLSKLCARCGIPVPPRGHWAKLAGGNKSPQKRLPSPSKDFSITLPPRSKPEPVPEDDVQREQIAAIAMQADALADVIKQAQAQPVKPHSAIKSTQAYRTKIPVLQRRYDRLLARHRLPRTVELPFLHKGVRQLSSPRAIGMLISDENSEWALEMHQHLISILETMGCRFRLEKRPGSAGCDLACELAGEKVYLRLSENSGRYRFTARELEEAKNSEQAPNEWEWRGGGKFTWTVDGTEHALKQQWVLKKAELEVAIPVICATCLYMLETQPTFRQARLDDEERRRREAAEAERQRRAAQARIEQVRLGYEFAEEYEKTERLKAFLDYLDAQLMSYRDPYPERIKVWISTVRGEIKRNPPYLKEFGKAFYVRSWDPGPPDWWPPEIVWPEAKA